MLAVHSDQYWSGHSAGSIDSLPKLEAAKAFLKSGEGPLCWLLAQLHRRIANLLWLRVVRRFAKRRNSNISTLAMLENRALPPDLQLKKKLEISIGKH
jgi:hypothetical protein